MRNTKWVYKENLANIPRIKNVSKDILNILSNRGITDEKEISNFLNPNIKNIGDPFELSDVEKVVDRILEAINKKEIIYIYGDYDVDGITSTALSYLSLKEIGADVKYYIPLRDEGYGLNNDALTSIANEGGKIVITVDCGITSHGEISHGKSLGLDIIITDHHDIVNNILPVDAFAVINPKRSDNKYHFKSFAGVGTVFMLLLAVYSKLDRRDDIFSYLDIVAIGTVADIVTLTSDNRIFVKTGLELLRKSKSIGLRELLQTLFFQDFQTKIFQPSDIGFIIAPIFNAAGRLEDAKTSVELLVNQDAKVYIPIIEKLIKNNNDRKEIQEKIQEKAFEIIEVKKLYERNLILVADKEFHHGVMGIVCSKILDKFYKPTIIIEINETEKTAKGSCRSTESFNMIEALTKFSGYLAKFGGHHGAAGFTMPLENLEKFYDELDKYCGEILQEGDVLRPIKIEDEIPIYKVAYDLVNNISLMEPYGFGNATPLFSMTKVEYRDLKLIGKEGRHLSMTLVRDSIEIRNCVWWGGADMVDYISNSTFINVAFKIKMEIFKSKMFYRIYIEDIKAWEKVNDNSIRTFDYESVFFPIKTIIYSQKIITTNIAKIKFLNGSGIVYHNKENIGYLDLPTTYLLKKYAEATNDNFSVKIEKTVECEENYNVYISIYRDFTFESLAIKESQLFQDIKKYLLRNDDYTEFQKQILKNVFHDKKDFELTHKYDSEFEIALLTIAIYYHYKKNTLLIDTDILISDKVKFFADVKDCEKKKCKTMIVIKNDKIIFSGLENNTKNLN
ncbi:MAG: single-stranded-DNA-specific exonuclease RecJ [Fusobacteriaceae bacterium]